MNIQIPESNLKRVVIIGAGFGGLALARELASKNFQIVLIDKNNYHQFQPLFYQVATSGLEPSAISFPLRKAFQSYSNVHIRITEVKEIYAQSSEIVTSLGTLKYDYLVLAMGADTNYYGNRSVMQKAMPMKSVGEALAIRNTLLQNLEDALSVEDQKERQRLLNIVVVGGGPTGVEVSGTLAEMKRTVLPKDFPDLDFSGMNIFLIEAGKKVLGPMSSIASEKATEYLKKLGVIVHTGIGVKDFDGETIYLSDGSTIESKNLIWAAGVRANSILGIPETSKHKNGRIIVDRYNRVQSFENIFAIGDQAFMEEEKFPNGHPQVVQPAVQQAKLLAKNLVNGQKGKAWKPFSYNDLGSMATVGRNLAVVDLPYVKFQGFLAWLFWMFVHLMSIVGVKNRLLIFINWFWNYLTYDQSLRLIMKPKEKEVEFKAES
ncbi:NAD(P)/FAD-dependent oxidoreductase [Sporocytophaga myxococcoides]|uniref:NAD(P)/FAD-dependent oxidoreductase n=1 Tax=Sporocytophaga myxococcoides TaxID=153721 RepID=UPI00041B443F|nr:NAD(P)/FAD-dependent oxidoreductase [Sporocytophaga myxococcoides]